MFLGARETRMLMERQIVKTMLMRCLVEMRFLLGIGKEAIHVHSSKEFVYILFMPSKFE
jgi:hypothetical protein